VLVYSHHEHRLMHHWAADHTMNLAWWSPLLALDMYEHAYVMDYGARAAAYVDAFMPAINWTFADGLHARASA
jgi:superoxide dismutase, Fe-Mn family